MNGMEAVKKPSTALESFKNDLKQLKLLLWKNFTIQKRSIIGTILEIIVPTLFVIILLPVRSIVKSEYFSNDTTYTEFSFDHLPSNLMPKPSIDAPFFKGLEWTFAYQPNTNNMTNRIMEQVGVKLGMNIIGFERESDMVEYLQDPLFSNERLGGISFINESLANFTYAIRLSYAPRNSGETDAFKTDTDWKTQFIYDFFPVLGPREKGSNDGGTPGYQREGFLAIQKAVDFAFISEFNSSVNDIEIQLKRFPFPPYNDDQLIVVMQTILPFMIVLSLIFMVIITAKSIAHEKETGIKEAMKLMGMKTWIYWLSWYIRTMLLLLPSLIFIIVSFKVKIQLTHGGKASIIEKTDPVLFGLFIFLYASCSVTFTFLCSTFFKKANSAAAGAGIIWFFSYLPFIFISVRYEKMSLFDKIVSMILNNLALSEGLQLIGQSEGKGTGINFNNWTSGISVDDNFCMIIVLAFMILNHFIYLSLMWYFDQIIPGDHGIAKPWYFPLAGLKGFLFPDLEDQRKLKEAQWSESIASRPKNFEDELPVYLEDESIYSSKKVGICIKNLSKEFTQFGKLKKAVDDLSLNIYEGQISVLLGHNGAGKRYLYSACHKFKK